MGVELVSEREHLRLVAPQEATPPPAQAPKAESQSTAQLISVLSAISLILAVRLILLVGVAVGGALAFYVADKGGVARVAVSVIYDLFVVGPLIFLAVKKG